MQTQASPRRRGRPRKTPSQFPGTVIPFSSRPRIVIGDVVELCRGCLPANRGKMAIVIKFLDDGRILVRSLFLPFHTADPDTHAPTGPSMTAALQPQNLYRRSKDILRGMMLRALP